MQHLKGNEFASISIVGVIAVLSTARQLRGLEDIAWYTFEFTFAYMDGMSMSLLWKAHGKRVVEKSRDPAVAAIFGFGRLSRSGHGTGTALIRLRRRLICTLLISMPLSFMNTLSMIVDVRFINNIEG